MRDVCYLDGELLPVTEARIDPRDRGFLFGDAFYEVFRVEAGRPFRLAAHLERLAKGLAAADIPLPPDLEGAVASLIAAAELERGSVYLQVTRGVGPRRHIPPADLRPTVLLLPQKDGPSPPMTRSLAAVTTLDRRWGRCDLKTTSLMATVLGKLDARRLRADEVLFSTGDGTLREGGSTNVFVLRRGRLETHPADGHILPGVTRHALIEIAGEVDLPVRERAPRLAEHASWDALLLTGTLVGLQRVSRLDGATVAPTGQPSSEVRELLQSLAAAFARREAEEIAGA